MGKKAAEGRDISVNSLKKSRTYAEESASISREETMPSDSSGSSQASCSGRAYRSRSPSVLIGPSKNTVN